MNYIYFKEHFPKTCQKFFEWVSTQDSNCKNDYVDNVYFYLFSCEFFGTQWGDKNNYYSVGDRKIYITEKKHIEVIKPRLDINAENNKVYLLQGRNQYETDFKILFGKFSDTKEDFIRIRVDEAGDFKTVFKCFEILLNEGFYE